ncbi:MAG: hypothetical protein JNK53_02890 [Phycisphaerae bacterium]|nr:hypothetical protein [Phycisphaerae bacterium]
MLQRILHTASVNYAMAVFWVYVAAFCAAFMSIFVFPPAALAMVFAGALLLVPAVAVGKILRAAARAANRPYLRSGVCPVCRAKGMRDAPLALPRDEGEPSEVAAASACPACGARYEVRGEWLPPA